jgi:hypothetical protein
VLEELRDVPQASLRRGAENIDGDIPADSNNRIA